MLEISDDEERIRLSGRFDAAQVEKAETVFSRICESRLVDFAELVYISSAGLGVLLQTQQRLAPDGHELTLISLNHHIRDVFTYSGLDQIFTIL